MAKVVHLDSYRLSFHMRVIPALRLIAEKRKDSGEMLSAEAEGICETSHVFDCRGLPVALLDDVGAEAFEHMRVAQTPITLPFPDAYFEFADEIGIYANECSHWQGAITEEALENDTLTDDAVEMGTAVEFRAFANWSRHVTPQAFADSIEDAYGEFPNGIDLYQDDEPIDFFATVNCHSADSEQLLNKAARRLLGVVSLFDAGQIERQEVLRRTLLVLRSGR